MARHGLCQCRRALTACALAALSALAVALAVAGQDLPFEVPEDSIGPFLRFSGVEEPDTVKISVLVVSSVPTAGRPAGRAINCGCHPPMQWQPTPQGAKGTGVADCLSVSFPEGVATVGAPELIDTHAGYEFVRWKVSLTMGDEQQAAAYSVSSTCDTVTLSEEVRDVLGGCGMGNFVP